MTDAKGKSSQCLWQGELKREKTPIQTLFLYFLTVWTQLV